MSRIEEMTWSRTDEETCDNLGLWLGMLEAIAWTGVKEIANDEGNVGPNQMLALPSNEH